jgi:hypothetical protein
MVHPVGINIYRKLELKFLCVSGFVNLKRSKKEKREFKILIIRLTMSLKNKYHTGMQQNQKFYIFLKYMTKMFGAEAEAGNFLCGGAGCAQTTTGFRILVLRILGTVGCNARFLTDGSALLFLPWSHCLWKI